MQQDACLLRQGITVDRAVVRGRGRTWNYGSGGKGLAAPAAIGAAAKGAASKVASVPRGVRGQTLRNEIRTRLLPPTYAQRYWRR
jgi:hypothetical protein